MNKRKLVVLDVDGVLTDGTKMYGIDGSVFGKRFCDRDFTAIKRFKMSLWEVVWLSADNCVNKVVAENRKITFYSSMQGQYINKIFSLGIILDDYQMMASDVIYAGDDLFDIPVMEFVNANGGMTFCPANAAKHVKDVAQHTTKSVGGDGVVMDIMDFYGFSKESPCS